MATTNVTIRMDKDLKKQADELFSALGLNMSTAMGVFCRQAVRLGKIPFELAVDTPNAETLAAIDDVNNNRNMSKAYDDITLFNKERVNRQPIVTGSFHTDFDIRNRGNERR